MLSFLFFTFASFFAFIALVNLALSWWLRSFLTGGSRSRKRQEKYQQYSQKQEYGQNTNSSQRHSQSSAHAEPAKLVQCAYCQTYIPLSTCYQSEERHFCHEEHYKLFTQNS